MGTLWMAPMEAVNPFTCHGAMRLYEGGAAVYPSLRVMSIKGELVHLCHEWMHPDVCAVCTESLRRGRITVCTDLQCAPELVMVCFRAPSGEGVACMFGRCDAASSVVPLQCAVRNRAARRARRGLAARLAAAMALHPRLGAASLLGRWLPDVLIQFTLRDVV